MSFGKWAYTSKKSIKEDKDELVIECGPAMILSEETGRFEMGEQFTALMGDVIKLVQEQGYTIESGMDIGNFLEQLDRLLESDANLGEGVRHFLTVATDALKKAAYPTHN